jgi:hypothetical protein
LEFIMKIRLLSAVLVAVSAAASVPAFTNGYGPAPFYHPLVGAPASQRCQSEQTVVAEREQSGTQANTAYGGVSSQGTQSGRPTVVVRRNDE